MRCNEMRQNAMECEKIQWLLRNYCFRKKQTAKSNMMQRSAASHTSAMEASSAQSSFE